MCSNNISEFINKENVQPLSSMCKREKLDAKDLNVIQMAPRELKPVATRHSDFFHYDDEDSDSDNIGTQDLLRVRKRRADSPPLLKPESLALDQKFYCDLNSIYINGYEYSFEEIRYRKWLGAKKEKAEKRSKKEMAKEIVNLKRKVESNEQAIQMLQDKLSTVMALIQVDKPASEDKQEVSTMIRDLINGSYNDTQLEKTMLQPVPSIPVKDFTIYKDMTIEAPTLVASAQDNLPLIRFDITECNEAAKHLISSSGLSNSKGLEKSIDNQTFNLKKSGIGQKNLQIQVSDENLIEIKKQTFKIHEDSIENEEPTLQNFKDNIEHQRPALRIQKDSIEGKKPVLQIQADSNEMKKTVLQILEDSIENKEPTLQVYNDSIETKKPALQIQADSNEMKKTALQILEDSIEIKEPNCDFLVHKPEIKKQSFQIEAPNKNLIEVKESNLLMDSIEIKEPDCDFLGKFPSDAHDPIDMEIEKAELKISHIKSSLGETKRKSLLNMRDNNKLSMIAENSRDSTNVTEKNSPVKMCPPVVPCKSLRNDLDLADLSVNPIIHRGSMHFRVSEAFTMYIPNSEDECVPKSCSTPGKT